MPTNKKAQLRYETLDRCFRDFNRKYTIEDLLDEVNNTLIKYDCEPIKMRQLRLDIKDMKDRGATIDTIPMYGKVCYYRYDDPHYALYRTELSLEDLQELRSTLRMLDKSESKRIEYGGHIYSGGMYLGALFQTENRYIMINVGPAKRRYEFTYSELWQKK